VIYIRDAEQRLPGISKISNYSDDEAVQISWRLTNGHAYPIRVGYVFIACETVVLILAFLGVFGFRFWGPSSAMG
jgi:hypothetical protein